MNNGNFTTEVTALDLPFYTLDVSIRFEEKVELPAFPGTTLHGGFGHALMTTSESLYKRVFDPVCENGKALIKPYAFTVAPLTSRQFNIGDKWKFSLTIFGNRVSDLPEIIAAIFHWQELGLGASRARFLLETIFSVFPLKQTLYSQSRQFHLGAPATLNQQLELVKYQTTGITADAVLINCTSPWHIKQNRKPLRKAPDADVLMRLVIGRLNRLCNTFYPQAAPLTLPPMETSLSLSNERTQHHFLNRYSIKDKQRHPIDELRGSWHYEGDISQLVPVLVVAQHIGIGNKTTFGFGQFEWQLASTVEANFQSALAAS